jgi:S-formylglutathione hydrolase FrmB
MLRVFKPKPKFEFKRDWGSGAKLEEIIKPENWEKYTVINLVPTLTNGQISIIVDCGKDDFFFEVNKNFHEALDKQGIAHDYIVRPGKHNREYWYNSIEYQILYFSNHFKNGLNK